MSAPRTALLMIDVQESFRHRPYYEATLAAPFFAAASRLAAGFGERDLPVVRVLHVEGAGPFSLASGLVTPMPEVTFEAALTVHKSVHSALAGTALSHWLIQHGIGRLAVAGIRTEQCCETTTRHASDLGYAVDYVTEATLTFPMQHHNGRLYSADDIKERTELVLAGRFATICSVDEALQRAA